MIVIMMMMMTSERKGKKESGRGMGGREKEERRVQQKERKKRTKKERKNERRHKPTETMHRLEQTRLVTVDDTFLYRFHRLRLNTRWYYKTTSDVWLGVIVSVFSPHGHALRTVSVTKLPDVTLHWNIGYASTSRALSVGGRKNSCLNSGNETTPEGECVTN